MHKYKHSAKALRSPVLRLGFVPLTDAAPLILAQELGLFRKYGLQVRLSRELGWASIRDKIAYGELEAAHALAAMPITSTLGFGSVPCDCLTALVLNLHGNAITLSNDLWRRGVRDGKSLHEEIVRSRREKMYTFGVVFSFSSHRHLLRRWFAAHGIDAERDVRFVVVPPPQMVANLRAGHLDGFCVGEPWNSMAVQARAGWIAATSAELDPQHPEKVLMVRGDFAANRREEHLALVSAVREACEFCDQPEHEAEIATILARPEFVGAPAEILRRALSGRIDCGNGITRQVEEFIVFHRNEANVPASSQAAWALQLVRSSSLCPQPAKLNFALGRSVYRADLYQQSSHSSSQNPLTPIHETSSELQTV